MLWRGDGIWAGGWEEPREDLPGEAKLEQTLEGGAVASWGKSVPGRGNSQCEVPKLGKCLECSREGEEAGVHGPSWLPSVLGPCVGPLSICHYGLKPRLTRNVGTT